VRSTSRLSVDGETVIEPAKPVVLFGDVPVAVPPGGFLQATAEAEHAMAALVTDHLAGARHVADLFAGSGTFALRLASRSRVHAAEGDAAALAALEEGARRAAGLKPVTAEKRDLFNRPLLPRELDAFDGLVFDPPRAGAEAQCRQIARSKVRRVAAVSCNPGTLARDLAILKEGGYRITRVTPIDQFLWSPHVEVVALLERIVSRSGPS
jgi:23S rRNA (uracil1939-C5)-methyltransferase